ncbi:hypothetical protein EON78_02725 [bacterium]|nr:MAG: hypothetical protein EON78_02725 [bacterium]
MKVKISVGEKVFTATLKNNATSRDFVSLLPLTLNMEDYANTEKVNYLFRKLVVSDDVPSGDTPTVGDIGYYAPWGNLIIYYKDFAYSSGLVKLGKIDSGIEAFNGSGNLLVKFEVID